MRANRAGDQLDYRAGMLARLQEVLELGAHHGLTAGVPQERELVHAPFRHVPRGNTARGGVVAASA